MLTNVRTTFEWLKKKLIPKRDTRMNFIHVSRNGTVSVDLWGWWRTPEGRAEREAQRAALKRFEAHCRATSGDGSFSFYD